MASAPLTVREYAYVSITGPGTHDAITAALGLKPTQAWNAGDTNPRSGKPLQRMQWRLESGLDDRQPLREHIDALLGILGTRAASLRSLWRDYDITLECVGYYPPMTHGAHLDSGRCANRGDLGLEINLDFYFVEEQPLE